jgi:hypothetical protein
MPPQDDLQFNRAEPSGEQAALACAVCGRPIADAYFEANGNVVCESCKRTVEAEWHAGGSAGRFGKALGLGVLATIACSVVWYLVFKWTDRQWAILAIAVGLLVGGAVRKGSNGRGGWRYQTLAIFLTYTAIVSSYVPFALEGIRNGQEVTQAADSTAAAGTDSVAAATTVESSAVESPGAIAIVVALIVLVPLLYAMPFLTALQAPIGLLIVGFALYEAWKLNKRVELKITGPYQVARA